MLVMIIPLPRVEWMIRHGETKEEAPRSAQIAYEEESRWPVVAEQVVEGPCQQGKCTPRNGTRERSSCRTLQRLCWTLDITGEAVMYDV